MVCEAARLRDACILLAGHRPYREYPLDWITRQMATAGLKVVAAKRWPVLYSPHTIKRQVRLAIPPDFGIDTTELETRVEDSWTFARPEGSPKRLSVFLER